MPAFCHHIGNRTIIVKSCKLYPFSFTGSPVCSCVLPSTTKSGGTAIVTFNKPESISTSPANRDRPRESWTLSQGHFIPRLTLFPAVPFKPFANAAGGQVCHNRHYLLTPPCCQYGETARSLYNHWQNPQVSYLSAAPHIPLSAGSSTYALKRLNFSAK